MGAILGLLANAGTNLLGDLINTGKDKAVQLIKDKTGIDLNKKQSLTQDEIQKLQEFEKNNKDFILKQIELFNQDRDSARKMQELALQQDGWLAKNFIYLYASIWSIFAMSYITAITFFTIPATSQRFADTILGFLLGTIVSAIIQFFFGSSLGSKTKDNIIKTKEIKNDLVTK